MSETRKIVLDNGPIHGGRPRRAQTLAQRRGSSERLVHFRARRLRHHAVRLWRRRADRSRFREVTWRSKATAAVPSPLIAASLRSSR